MKESEILKIKARTFFEAGELLRYSYDGPFDLSSIEDFFDDKAQDLMLEAARIEAEETD